MTSTQQSLIGLASLLALAGTVACGSESTESDNTAAGASAAHGGAGGAPATSGGGSTAAGAPSAGAPSAGAPSAGAPSAGAPSAGAPSAGAPSTGGASAGGSSNASAGAGGAGRAGAGAAGGSAAGAGGGGAATFAQVATLLGTACAGAMCHGGGNHTNLTMMNGLYARLTMPLPATAPHCVGTRLVVPSDVAGSFLAKVVQGMTTCMNGARMENLPRMPNQCSTTSTMPRACLKADQIKTITDWIGAGAQQ